MNAISTIEKNQPKNVDSLQKAARKLIADAAGRNERNIMQTVFIAMDGLPHHKRIGAALAIAEYLGK